MSHCERYSVLTLATILRLDGQVRVECLDGRIGPPGSGRRALVGRRIVGLVFVVLALMTCSCLSGYQFVRDTRLTFVAPHQNAFVHEPVTVRWTMRGGLPKGNRFAVLVDESPPAPGHRLPTDDPEVLTTTQNRCLIAAFGPEANGGTQEHQVTVVLVDSRLVRQGESEWILMLKAPSADN